MKKEANKRVLGYALIAILLVAIFVFYFTSRRSVVKLSGVEVRDYQGEKLSSVNDFIENSIRGPQYINISDYKLEVFGLVENPRNYSYDNILKKQSYEKVVTLYCVEGWDVRILWQGILVKDLLNEVKPMNATTVIFYAYDGFTTSFPIEYFDNNIIMAYKMNNVTIPPERGFPFMLVAESKWGYKWVKWITKIELSNDTNYEGYWERRGYSNTANLNESFY